MFDEFEEWEMIMGHYCIALAVQDAGTLLEGWGFNTYDVAPATALAAKGLRPGVTRPPALPNAD